MVRNCLRTGQKDCFEGISSILTQLRLAIKVALSLARRYDRCPRPRHHPAMGLVSTNLTRDTRCEASQALSRARFGR